MPGFFPGRPGGEHDEPLLDMILERRPLPPGAPPEIHGLARMLAAVAGPAESGELAGQAAAHAAFTRVAPRPGISHAALRSARRSLSERPARGRLPLAALAVAAAGLGSTAAAYIGVLPGPIQHFANMTIGAPPPHASPGTLTVSTAPMHRGHQPGNAASGSRHPASSDPAGDKTRSTWPAHGRKGYPGVPGVASCLPAQGQDHGRAAGHAQRSAQPSPASNQGKSVAQSATGASPGPNRASPGSVPAGWPVPSMSATTVCPGGTAPAAETNAPGR